MKIPNRKLRTLVSASRWSQTKYVNALEKVQRAAEDVVSPNEDSLIKLLARLERALDAVPLGEKEAWRRR